MKHFIAPLIALLLAAPAFAQTVIPRADTSDRPQIDVESYAIEATIDPFEGELIAAAEIRFIQMDRQRYAVFDLDRRLRVRDVYVGTEPVPARFRQFDIDSTLEVDLGSLEQFDQPVVRIEYDGILNPEEGRRESILARIDGESAFLLEEARWYPVNGVGRDAAMLDLHLTVPAGWRVVSEMSEAAPEAPATTEGDSLLVPSRRSMGETTRLRLLGEAPGFWGTLIAGGYESVRASEPGQPEVEAVVFPDSVEAASEMGRAAAELIDFYTETFGPPAASSFRIVEIDGANWDAQSSPGMLMLPSREVRVDFDEWELARSVAAQWFPLAYGIADPVSDAWLAEGLAVFAALRYFEETLAPLDAREHLRRALVKSLSYEGQTPVGSAGSLPADSTDYRTLAAYKGGFIFRMLVDVVGEENFDAMLDAFPSSFADRPLSTRAVLDLASDAAGEDLTYFFDQWLNSAGVPEFERQYTVFRLSDGYKVMGQIQQDLDLFRMPVEVEVETDGEPEYYTVWVSGPSSDFDLLTERKPRNIRIDPNMRMLRLSPDIRVSVHISRGEDYAESGRFNEAIDEYQAAVDLDRLSSLAFFRMGEALFELGNLQAAANVFREALNGDLQPRWIEVWTYVNLGKIYDIRGQRERAVTEYQKAVNTGDDAYGAQAEATRYIDAPFRRSGPTIGL